MPRLFCWQHGLRQRSCNTALSCLTVIETLSYFALDAALPWMFIAEGRRNVSQLPIRFSVLKPHGGAIIAVNGIAGEPRQRFDCVNLAFVLWGTVAHVPGFAAARVAAHHLKVATKIFEQTMGNACGHNDYVARFYQRLDTGRVVLPSEAQASASAGDTENLVAV
jgi:hypothetical protein